MSSYGKASLFISAFCLIVMTGARFILGAWHPLLFAFLAVFMAGIIVSVLFDYKLYLEFLSIKTAKKGLSLGWSLFILIVFLTALSYLGNRFNRSFDLTEEGINSLSEQTITALKKLDSPATFYIFYKGDKISQQVQMLKQELKNNLSLYKQNSSQVKMLLVDTYRNNLKAEEYLSDLPDKNQQELFVFISYKNRKIRAEAPFSEESLTSALIKSQKRQFKEILFLTGHGEKELNSSEPGGLKILRQSLEDSGFIIKEWNFVKQGAPPSSVSLIASIGPQGPFLDTEKNWMQSYLSQGGKILFLLDPKEKHQLKNWLKNYGLLFNNDFILSQLGLLYGGPTKALGVQFDLSHPITKGFSNKQAVFFEKASSLDILPEAFEKFQFSYLVRSHNQSFTAKELKRNIKMGKLSSLNMTVEVQNKSPSSEKSSDSEKSSEKKKKEGFRLIVFGDSDFVSNRYIYDGANRDLILNSFVSLAGEEDLVSIRPKQPKGTKITLNRIQKTILIFIYISLPILFFLTALWLWYRRRNA